MAKKLRNGLTPEALIHCGRDHVFAAFELFSHTEQSHIYMDSAGYLIYMGFECLLKGILLLQEGAIEATHDIEEICEKINIDLDDKYKTTLEEINTYKKLRYPDLDHPTQVCFDYTNFTDLYYLIVSKVPEEINLKPNGLHFTKGNRILMKKKINENDEF